MKASSPGSTVEASMALRSMMLPAVELYGPCHDSQSPVVPVNQFGVLSFPKSAKLV